MTPTYRIAKGTKVLVSDTSFVLHEHTLQRDYEYTWLEIIKSLPSKMPPDPILEQKFAVDCDDGRVKHCTVRELEGLNSHVVKTQNPEWPFIVCERRIPVTTEEQLNEAANKAIKDAAANLKKSFEESFNEIIAKDHKKNESSDYYGPYGVGKSQPYS